MPTVEGLTFAYALYQLPPGRLPFRRWRWELWHGATWSRPAGGSARPDAGRALRVHAPSSATGCSGCPCPRATRAPGAATCAPAAPSGWRSAPISATLVPRA